MAGADPGVFAAVFVVWFAAHQVGDHWLQTGAQASGKGGSGWAGRVWCVRHVAVLTGLKAAALALAALVVELPLNPLAVAVALVVDGVSHYWADRRTTLVALADRVGARLVPGKGEFARLGDNVAAPAGTGAYALDQSWHVGWLLAAALIACAGGA